MSQHMAESKLGEAGKKASPPAAGNSEQPSSPLLAAESTQEHKISVDDAARQALVRRFWHVSTGFWRKGGNRRAWIFTGAVLVIVVLQLFMQYRVNVWNRSLFDALEQKNGSEALLQSMIYVPLLVGSVILAIVSVYCRMTLHRLWREW